ncbi:MAG: NAD(P)-binding domain-containing protein [Aquabacterium sp.]|uniref:NAD(P)-binding domain-containing protein n=1 Tax=Aquabacterium sp. TaxID=1872578 RepID=UPI003BAE6BD3
MQETKHDYVIVGAGPAGLQLGAFLKKAGRDFVILESGEGPGTFFKKFPRHRKLISANKVYTGYTDKVRNMRWDWNSLISDDDTLLFKHYSKEFFPPADSMVTYLQDFADKLDLPIHYNRTVSRISRHGDFRIETSNGDVYHGKRLLMATGVSLPYIPDVPGIEHAEVYTDVSVDPDDFTDQKVLILGKGNSAFETADNLMNTEVAPEKWSS